MYDVLPGTCVACVCVCTGTFKKKKSFLNLNEHKVYAMYVLLHTHMFILHTLSIEYLLAHTLHVYTHVKLHVCM